MPIWSAEIKELEKLYESIKGQLPALEKELEQLIRTDDANVIMLYSRRCLEVMITDLCERELKRQRGTEPLKGIIDKLHKERKVPDHISTSMHGLNDLSTYGTHPKDFDPAQVKPVLNNLDIIIKWYLKYKGIGTGIKSKPAEGIKQDIKSTTDAKKEITISRKKLSGLLFGSIAIIVILFAVFFFVKIIGGNNKTGEPEKSIAVLPFFNDSPDSENASYINGLMGEILNNLSKIKELSVRPRTSVEKYRNLERPPAPQIGKELNVSYLVDGHGQKYGNTILLTVELIDAAKDIQIWTYPYRRDLKDAGDFFAIQSQVAKAIATELKTIITPDEKQLIEKTPTTSLTAYDFFQKGRDEHVKYWIHNDNREALENAEEFYYKALEYDSAFAKAYTGLARVYWDKYYFKDYLSNNFMDSVLILCDIALDLDNQLAEAYTLKGRYYSETGNPERAVEEFDRAIKYNPNDWMAYRGKGEFYYETDWVNYIKYNQKALSINRGPEITDLLSNLGYAYASAGFFEKTEQYHQDKLELDVDSANYYAELARYENWKGNFNKSIEFGIKGYAIDSTNSTNLINLGAGYAKLGQYEESLKYYKKWIKRSENQGDEWFPGSSHRIGYVYSQNGNREAARYYFNKQIKICEGSIELGREYAKMLYAYYDLAGVYAFRGNKVKAYENLRIYNKKPMMSFWMISLIKTDPLFSSIRNEPYFQEIVKDVEAKYQAEHERVRKWLEEQGML